MPPDWHGKSRGSLCGDADMHAAVLMNDAGLVVETCVEAWVLADCAHHRMHQEWQGREFWLAGRARVQLLAQLFERCDVDFFDISEVRNTRTGRRDLLGDHAAQARDLGF